MWALPDGSAEQDEVLPDGSAEQDGVLEDDGEARPQGVQGQLGDVDVVNHNTSCSTTNHNTACSHNHNTSCYSYSDRIQIHEGNFILQLSSFFTFEKC